MLEKTESELLYQIDSAFYHTASDALMCQLLQEVDYNIEKINAGKQLTRAAQAARLTCWQEKSGQKIAHAEFVKKKEALQQLYQAHRRQAFTLFAEDLQARITLGLGKRITAHFPWLENVKGFYAAILAEEGFKAQFIRIKTSEAQLREAQQLTLVVAAAYSAYLKQKRAAIRSVEAKNKAFTVLKKHFRAFYRIAKLAFKDDPGLLKYLGKKKRRRKAEKA